MLKIYYANELSSPKEDSIPLYDSISRSKIELETILKKVVYQYLQKNIIFKQPDKSFDNRVIETSPTYITLRPHIMNPLLNYLENFYGGFYVLYKAYKEDNILCTVDYCISNNRVRIYEPIINSDLLFCK